MLSETYTFILSYIPTTRTIREQPIFNTCIINGTVFSWCSWKIVNFFLSLVGGVEIIQKNFTLFKSKQNFILYFVGYEKSSNELWILILDSIEISILGSFTLAQIYSFGLTRLISLYMYIYVLCGVRCFNKVKSQKKRLRNGSCSWGKKSIQHSYTLLSCDFLRKEKRFADLRELGNPISIQTRKLTFCTHVEWIFA